MMKNELHNESCLLPWFAKIGKCAMRRASLIIHRCFTMQRLAGQFKVAQIEVRLGV
jgi:hypothetical protein